MSNEYQIKAEAYVREHCPELKELSFGCEFIGQSGGKHFIYHVAQSHPFWFQAKTDATGEHYHDFQKGGDFQIIGHPIQLQHWLRVLLAREVPKNEYKETVFIKRDGTFTVGWVDDIKQESGVYAVKFDLTTGQPATEADYQAFNEIVGV